MLKSDRWIRKMGNGAFGRMEILEFLLRLDHRCCGEQTAVLRKAGEPDQCSDMFETRNSVADRFRGFRRHGGADRLSKFFQLVSCRFGHTCKVIVDALGSGPARCS